MTGREYMRLVAQLPCAVCGRYPVEVHHVICGRFSQARSSDLDTIPLCDRHHQGKWDTGGPSIHKHRQRFLDAFGPDTDYIAATRQRVERLRDGVI